MQVYKNDIQAARAALESGVDVNAPDQESGWYARASASCCSAGCAKLVVGHCLQQNVSIVQSTALLMQDCPAQGVVLGSHPHRSSGAVPWSKDIPAGQQGSLQAAHTRAYCCHTFLCATIGTIADLVHSSM